MRYFIAIILFVLNAYSIKAQDIHHTMYWLTPSNTNSALVGDVRGTSINLIHRNQHFTITPNLFVRNSMTIDRSLTKNWGVGVNLHNSKSGNAGVRYNSVQGLVSYKIPFNKNDYFRIGSRIGLGQFETVNIGNLRFENDLLNIPNPEVIPTERPLSYRLGGGMLYNKTIGKSLFQLGFDTRYNWLTSLDQEAYISDNRWLKIYSIAYKQPITKTTYINVRGMYQNIGKAYELQANTVLETKMDKKKSDLILYGIGYRYKDALQYIIGYSYGPYTAMLAYDHNISKLAQASKGVGAIELGLQFLIGKKDKKVKRPFVLINSVPSLPIKLLTYEKLKMPTHLTNPIPKINQSIKLLFGNLTHQNTEIHLKYGRLDTVVLIGPNSSLDINKLDDSSLLKITTEGYEDITINLIRDSKDSAYKIDFVKKKTPINFDPIYYDFDLSIIRKNQEHPLDIIYKAMLENPNLNIQFDAYTDSRGTEAYNLALSQKRSNSAKQYLTQKGISPTRIIANYHGESTPVIDCNTQRCTEKEHALNRRTEVRIVD